MIRHFGLALLLVSQATIPLRVYADEPATLAVLEGFIESPEVSIQSTCQVLAGTALTAGGTAKKIAGKCCKIGGAVLVPAEIIVPLADAANCNVESFNSLNECLNLATQGFVICLRQPNASVADCLAKKTENEIECTKLESALDKSCFLQCVIDILSPF